MTDIFTPTLIATAAIAIAVGILLGAGLFFLVQRSQTGGKTLAALRQEHEDYQESVEQHFDQSAVLFKKLTDDYREFYEHMANGAHSLCKEEPTMLPLDLSKAAALPEPGKDTAEQLDSDAPPTPAPDAASQAEPDSEAAAAPDAAAEQTAESAPETQAETPVPSSETGKDGPAAAEPKR